MSKTRLTKEMRSQLEQLARTSVKDSPEFEKPYQQARTVALAGIKRVAVTKLPLKDLKVLQKYGVAEFDACPCVVTEPDEKNTERRYLRIPFVGSLNDNNYEQIKRAEEEKKEGVWIPKSANCKIFLDKAATQNLDYWLQLDAERTKRLSDLIKDLYTLISNTRNLEDLEAVWPAAMQIRAKYPVANLPAVRIDDVVARIQAAIANKNL